MACTPRTLTLPRTREIWLSFTAFCAKYDDNCEPSKSIRWLQNTSVPANMQKPRWKNIISFSSTEGIQNLISPKSSYPNRTTSNENNHEQTNKHTDKHVQNYIKTYTHKQLHTHHIPEPTTLLHISYTNISHKTKNKPTTSPLKHSHTTLNIHTLTINKLKK